jgi:DNA-binding NtrC family response regulator
MVSHASSEADKEPTRILVVGGSPEVIAAFETCGLEVHPFATQDDVLVHARELRGRACVVCSGVLDSAADIDRFVRRLRTEAPFLDVIGWAPDATPREVRDALLQGVRDLILDPEPDALVSRVVAIVDRQRYLPRLLQHDEDLAERWEFEGMLSRSQKMREVFEVCVRTASTDATVLILGETGTGKELLARAFHRRSERTGRLVTINCSAVPENLIDSELFGHVRGAFTGAERAKEGLFRYADGGTLFLDEVGSIPLQVQYRLLRVLQEGTLRPVGSDREYPVDVRVIAATSVRLDEEVDSGRFRHDLLYRLDVIRTVLPPLRQRPEDILFLFGHFLRKLADHHGLPRPEIEDDFLDVLQTFEWPGNVRQLENLTERLLLTHRPNEPLTADHFVVLVAPPHDREADTNGFRQPNLPDLEHDLPSEVEAAVDRTEENYLRAALGRTGGRVGRTADIAGISRRTLLRKLKRLGIDRMAYRERSTDHLTGNDSVDD